MPKNRDTLRAAHAFIERFGERSSLEAAQRAKELKEAGDPEGQRRWLNIKAEIENILRNSSNIRN